MSCVQRGAKREVLIVVHMGQAIGLDNRERSSIERERLMWTRRDRSSEQQCVRWWVPMYREGEVEVERERSMHMQIGIRKWIVTSVQQCDDELRVAMTQ